MSSSFSNLSRPMYSSVGGSVTVLSKKSTIAPAEPSNPPRPTPHARPGPALEAPRRLRLPPAAGQKSLAARLPPGGRAGGMATGVGEAPE